MDNEETAKQIFDGQITLPQERRLKYIQIELAKISDKNAKSEIEEIVLTYLTYNQVPPQKTITVLIHGIRTFATWQEQLRLELEKHESSITYPIGYDYFDAIQFWCPFFTRKRPIDRVLNELRGIRSTHRNDKVCVVAHSFGTYIISQILCEISDIQLDRLLLCGSVIPQDFRWDKVVKFPIGGVLNDCGSKDMWPILAKCLSWGYGASGTYGFKTHKVTDRFHNLGHSDFFEDGFIKTFWLPFILEGKIIKSEWDGNRQSPSILLTLLSWFPIKTVSIVSIILYFTYPLWSVYLNRLLY